MPRENSLHLLDPLCLGIAIERSPVAQLVERVAVNHHVAGSSPARGATSSRSGPSHAQSTRKRQVQNGGKNCLQPPCRNLIWAENKLSGLKLLDLDVTASARVLPTFISVLFVVCQVFRRERLKTFLPSCTILPGGTHGYYQRVAERAGA